MLLRSVTGRSIVCRFLGDTIGKLVSFLRVVTVAREMGAAATDIYALANVLAEYATGQIRGAGSKLTEHSERAIF